MVTLTHSVHVRAKLHCCIGDSGIDPNGAQTNCLVHYLHLVPFLWVWIPLNVLWVPWSLGSDDLFWLNTSATLMLLEYHFADLKTEVPSGKNNWCMTHLLSGGAGFEPASSLHFQILHHTVFKVCLKALMEQSTWECLCFLFSDVATRPRKWAKGVRVKTAHTANSSLPCLAQPFILSFSLLTDSHQLKKWLWNWFQNCLLYFFWI